VRPSVRRGQAREVFLLTQRPPGVNGSSLRRDEAPPDPRTPSLPGGARADF
jgi:hypothetical protein